MDILNRTIRWPTAVLAPLVLALLQTGAVLVAPTAPVVAISHSTSTMRVMVVGDSISQGKAGDWTWRYRFFCTMTADSQRLAMVGPRTGQYNRATGRQGDQHYVDSNFDRDHDARWGQPLFAADRNIGAEVVAAAPDVLLVLLGINDLLKYDRTPAGTETHLRDFIANARAANPHIRLVLGTLLPTRRATVDAAFAGRVADYNRRLRAVAAQLDRPGSMIQVAETGGSIFAATDLYDGLHPNARGEIKIAAAFVAAMADPSAPTAAPPLL